MDDAVHFVFGTCDETPARELNVVERFTVCNRKWERLSAPYKPDPRRSGACAEVGDLVVLCGGVRTGAVGDVNPVVSSMEVVSKRALHN